MITNIKPFFDHLLILNADNESLCGGVPADTPDLSQFAVLVRFPTGCGFVSHFFRGLSTRLIRTFTVGTLESTLPDEHDAASHVGVRRSFEARDACKSYRAAIALMGRVSATLLAETSLDLVLRMGNW